MTRRNVNRILTCTHEDEQQPYPAPQCTVSGGARGSLGSMGDIWTIKGTLNAGAELTWSGSQGDEVLFVLDGRIQIRGQDVPTNSVLIVEANTVAAATVLEPTRTIHFGSTLDLPASDRADIAPTSHEHGIHIVARDEADGMTVKTADGTSFKTQYYADGTCQTCSAALLRVETDGPAAAPPHSHSVNEIIHVLRGEMHLGAKVVAAGMSLSVPADMRYAFKTDGPIEFINYRPEVSYFSDANFQSPALETVAGILAYIEENPAATAMVQG